MSEHLYVYTRKGLFLLHRDGTGPEAWRIGRTVFLGEPVSAALQDPRDGALYAALNLGHFGPKLHRSDDGGASWTELAPPSFPTDAAPMVSAMMNKEEPAVVSQVWSLAPGGSDEPGTLWAGTIPGALFVSRDRGASWSLIRSLWDRPERPRWFGGGYDYPGIHSVLVHPQDSRRLALAVSCGGVWLSADGGDSWQQGGEGLRAAFLPPEQQHDPVMQDPHVVSACAARPEAMWMQHHNGIFRSTDGGARWSEITAARPSAFGFAVAAHPADPDTAWFVPAVKDECRIPVDGRLVVTRTRDGGGSFEVLSTGLPQEHAYDLIYRHALDVDAAGERLAMGSTTGALWVSHDAGDSWRAVSVHLPPVFGLAFAPRGW